MKYEIRTVTGELVAVHVRQDHPDGTKSITWQGGLRGRPVASLPLYRSETVAGLPRDVVLIVTEGEKAADALVSVGLPALGTVTGAASCPTPDALRPVVRGRHLILWPDNDAAGWTHMVAVGAAARRAGAASIRIIAYRPWTEVAWWPAGFDAADLLAGCLSPELGRATVAMLVSEWADPLPRSRPIEQRPFPMPRHATFGSVSAALIEAYGLNARPGRNVKCPMHNDRNPSLSVLRDDERVICHSPGCAWSGRGAIASDIRARP